MWLYKTLTISTGRANVPHASVVCRKFVALAAVIPAKHVVSPSNGPQSGREPESIYFQSHWIPAFAGMTAENMSRISDWPY